MSHRYHIDKNNVAFLHLINSSFAGIFIAMEMLKEARRKVTKKEILEVLQDTTSKANTMLASEYIRGELIKKGVLENGDDTGLCIFDPSVDNENDEVEVFTNDELKAIRLERMEPTWKNSVKGR